MNLECASVGDVVGGDITSIELLAQGWRNLGSISADAATAVAQTATTSWKGTAAVACGRRVAPAPSWLRETSELLGEAVGILQGWLDEVVAARAEAEAVIESYRDGRAQHRWWLENHAAIEEATRTPLPDAGLELMAIAERRADRLRDDLDSTAERVGERLQAVADAGLSRFSLVDDLAHTLGGVAAGAGEATWSLVRQLSVLSPLRWMLDHQGASEQVKELRNGLKAGVELWLDDPATFVEQGLEEAIDVDGLLADPARWAGHLVPDFIAWAGGFGLARRSTRMLDSLIPDVPGAAVAYPSGSGSVVEAALSGLEGGRRSWVRVVDSEDDLWHLFLEMSQDAVAVDGTSRPGPFVRLADGTTVGIRPTSASGGTTIDITLPDGTRQRIHVR